MKIIFRYDDFSASESVSRQTDQLVFDLFLEHGLPLLVGVTPCMSKTIHDPANQVFYPFEQDPARIGLLRQGLEQGWQLALHGFTHQRTDQAQASEFAGRPRQVQAAKIVNGLGILRACFPGVAIDVFIPPWDSFDTTTVECLAAEGFQVVCGSYTTRAFSHPKVSFVPSLFETRGLVDYLRHYSMEDLERVAGDGWLVVTLHGYDFDGSRKGCFVSMPELREAIQTIQDSRVPIGVIPVNEKPPAMNPRQESILKGKILIGRRKLAKSIFLSAGPGQRNRAFNQIGDGVAALAWRMKTHLKAAR